MFDFYFFLNIEKWKKENLCQILLFSFFCLVECFYCNGGRLQYFFSRKGEWRVERRVEKMPVTAESLAQMFGVSQITADYCNWDDISFEVFSPGMHVTNNGRTSKADDSGGSRGGAPFFSDQINWGLKGQKKFVLRPSPPFSNGLDDQPPPPALISRSGSSTGWCRNSNVNYSRISHKRPPKMQRLGGRLWEVFA